MVGILLCDGLKEGGARLETFQMGPNDVSEVRGDDIESSFRGHGITPSSYGYNPPL